MLGQSPRTMRRVRAYRWLRGRFILRVEVGLEGGRVQYSDVPFKLPVDLLEVTAAASTFTASSVSIEATLIGGDSFCRSLSTSGERHPSTPAMARQRDSKLGCSARDGWRRVQVQP